MKKISLASIFSKTDKKNSKTRVMSALNEEELNLLEDYLEFIHFTTNDFVVKQGEKDRSMYFILEGKCKIQRESLEIGTLSEGDLFGELALIVGKPRAASIIALTDLTVSKLTYAIYEKMCDESPELAVKLMQLLTKALGKELVEMTDSVELLLLQRSIPRHVTVDITLDNKILSIKTGTPIETVLKEKKNGSPIVAALLNNKMVSLSRPLTSNSTIAPLTTKSWEGQRIYRRSTALMFFEAALEVDPNLGLHFGISIGGFQWVNITNSEEKDFSVLSKQITQKMKEMVKANAIFRNEVWLVEEAISYFNENNWIDAAKILHTLRDSTVPLISCGKKYALSMGPLVSHAGILENFTLYPTDTGLVLVAEGRKGKEDVNLNKIKELYTPYVNIMNNHERWLHSLGVKSVGEFNNSCISGHVSQIIRVAEGFHEKKISNIADQILEKADDIKLVCISGPSSSGKTTFIKRLSVQLQVNGIKPIWVSLDDYYLERWRLTPDGNGEYDFESLDSINTELLEAHIIDILAGKKVKTARYDFKSGKSIEDGGVEVQLGNKEILLIEGIHGLNPKLLGTHIKHENVFRIFIQPMTSLPFDHLSRINTSDLRLLRRIVRDRYQRGYKVEDNIMRWASVRTGEQNNIFPYIGYADAIFDTSLVYETSVLKVYAERYLLEVPQSDPAYATAHRLRQLIDQFVAIYPDHVPPTSILREFIGGSSFDH